MKAIAVLRHPGDCVETAPRMQLIADSAMVGAGRPLFLPDFAPSWRARIGLAFRISRLGKDIAPRFVGRYVDAFCLCMQLMPEGAAGDEAWGGLFDNCMALGTWRPVPDGEVIGIKLEDSVCDVGLGDIAVEQTVAAVSRYATLKTGDVIVAAFLPWVVGVKAGDDLRVDVDEEPALSVRVR